MNSMKKHRFFVKNTFKAIKRFKTIDKSIVEKAMEFMDKIRIGKKETKKKKRGLNLTLIFSLIFVFIIMGVMIYFISLIRALPPPPNTVPSIIFNPNNVVYGSFGTIFEKEKALWLNSEIKVKNADNSTFLKYVVIPDGNFDYIPNIYLLKSGLFDTSENAFFEYLTYSKGQNVNFFYNFQKIKNSNFRYFYIFD